MTYAARISEPSSNTPATSGTVTVNLSGTGSTLTFPSGTAAALRFVDRVTSGAVIPVHVFCTTAPNLWVHAWATFTDSATDTLAFVAADITDGSSGAGAIPSWSGAVTCELVPGADFFTSALLINKAETVVGSDVTGVVGAMHECTIAGLTATRDFILPASARANARVGVRIADGDATYALRVMPPSGGQIGTSGTDTEWSRLFIANECVIFRCKGSNVWVVEQDDRIPYQALLRLTTGVTTNTANTFLYPTDASGAWTADVDIGNVALAASGRVDMRRSGRVALSVGGRTNATTADGKYVNFAAELNGTTLFLSVPVVGAVSTLKNTGFASLPTYPVATGDYLRYKFRTEDANGGLEAQSAGAYAVHLAVREIL